MTVEDKKKLEKELKSEQDKLDIPVETIIEQVETFEKGISPVRIVKACTIDDGIKIIPEEQFNKYFDLFQNALNDERIIKFVPASGAASRMFKKLQSVLASSKTTQEELEKSAKLDDEEGGSVLEFMNNLERFAFYDDLKKFMQDAGLNLEELKEQGEYKETLKFTLNPIGLGYSVKPKG